MRSHRSHALFRSRFSGFPDLLRDAQPGTAKDALGYIQGFGRQPYFYTSIPDMFDKINNSPVLMAHDSGLGTQVRRY
jgi:hypothetical protein